MFNKEYSISREKLENIITSHFLEARIIAVSKLEDGIGSYMLHITLENPKKELIFRVLNPSRDRAFQKELGSIFYAEEHELCPVPNVLFHDDSGEIISEDYYAYEYIEKEPMIKTVKKLSFEEKKDLYFDLGKILGNMHSHHSEYRSNILFENEEIKLEKREDQSLFPKLKQDYQWLLKNSLNKGDFIQYRERCKDIFRKYKKYIEEKPDKIGFTHNDLSGDNIIVNGSKVSSFIDFTFSHLSDVCWELSRCERRLFLWKNPISKEQVEEFKKSFFEGYNKNTNVPNEYLDKKPIYLLIQIMDDMGMYPEFSKVMTEHQQRKLKERLCWEMENLVEEYG